MNCMSPRAPAVLVAVVAPWPVSSIPIPASRVHGMAYRSPAARYSFLTGAGMGAGGVRSDADRGVPGGGRGNPMPPSTPVGAAGGGGGDGAAVQRRAVVGHERGRVDGGPAVVDLEVEVVSGGGAGGAFDAEDLPDGDRGAGTDGGVDGGEVGVAGGDAAAVVDLDGVAGARLGPGGRDPPGAGGDDRAGPGQGDQVDPGVQAPDVVDGVVARPER